MSAPNPSINVADSRAVRVNVGHGGEEAEEEQPSCPNINFDQHNEMSAMPTKCMMCGADGGETRMLLTKIPMFREVIIASFQCINEECGHSNQSVDFAGAYQEQVRTHSASQFSIYIRKSSPPHALTGRSPVRPQILSVRRSQPDHFLPSV